MLGERQGDIYLFESFVSKDLKQGDRPSYDEIRRGSADEFSTSTSSF